MLKYKQRQDSNHRKLHQLQIQGCNHHHSTPQSVGNPGKWTADKCRMMTLWWVLQILYMSSHIVYTYISPVFLHTHISLLSLQKNILCAQENFHCQIMNWEFGCSTISLNQCLNHVHSETICNVIVCPFRISLTFVDMILRSVVATETVSFLPILFSILHWPITEMRVVGCAHDPHSLRVTDNFKLEICYY